MKNYISIFVIVSLAFLIFSCSPSSEDTIVNPTSPETASTPTAVETPTLVSDLGEHDIYGSEGAYSIDKVVLTNQLDENENPVGSVNTFTSYDTIFGWVGTKGAEGILGFRWFYGDKLIYEHFDKTTDNNFYTFIRSTNEMILPEGDYRLEIHTTGGTPREVLEFTVEQYQPEVVPEQPTPVGHQELEQSAFVEVPFVFDETWAIDGEGWQINEIKIVFLGDEAVFPAIVAETDEDISELSEQQIFELAKPIAIYAINNGYLEKGRDIEIDGVTYNLDEQIYVNLASSDVGVTDSGEPKKNFYRAGFNIADLQ